MRNKVLTPIRTGRLAEVLAVLSLFNMLSSRSTPPAVQWQQSLLKALLLPLTPAFVLLSAIRFYVLTTLADVIYLLQGEETRRRENIYLRGNYAPIHREVHSQQLAVEGVIPQAVNGAFVRTGPNPYFVPGKRQGYHWFDGDGMLHACRIKNGSVAYCNRFMDTFRLASEKAAGRAVFAKMGDYHGFGGLAHIWLASLRQRLGLTSSKHGLGTANTALVYHAKKLLSLHEGDLPYAARILCNGLIESLGREEFDGKVQHPFTAHPKLDTDTGELFFIGYRLEGTPRLHYAALDRSGALMFDQCITLPHAVMHHDFAITRDYALLIDHCLEFDGKTMVKENRLPFTFNYRRNVRVGVVPKRPADNTSKGLNVRWFELDCPMAVFHTANAWQDGDIIRLFACCFNKLDLESADGTSPPQLCEMWMNVRTGQAGVRRLQPCPAGGADFPRVRQDLIGKPAQYAYLGMIQEHDNPVMRGIAKYDLYAPPEKALVATISLGACHGGGEVFFVPADTDVAKLNGEDDGYLVTFVYDEAADASSFTVYDAKTMSDTPVGRAVLPQRVPYGFHCHHINEEQFQEHLTLSQQTIEAFARPR